jgi:hypothetical protein
MIFLCSFSARLAAIRQRRVPSHSAAPRSAGAAGSAVPRWQRAPPTGRRHRSRPQRRSCRATRPAGRRGPTGQHGCRLAARVRPKARSRREHGSRQHREWRATALRGRAAQPAGASADLGGRSPLPVRVGQESGGVLSAGLEDWRGRSGSYTRPLTLWSVVSVRTMRGPGRSP